MQFYCLIYSVGPKSLDFHYLWSPRYSVDLGCNSRTWLSGERMAHKEADTGPLSVQSPLFWAAARHCSSCLETPLEFLKLCSVKKKRGKKEKVRSHSSILILSLPGLGAVYLQVCWEEPCVGLHPSHRKHTSCLSLHHLQAMQRGTRVFPLCLVKAVPRLLQGFCILCLAFSLSEGRAFLVIF